MVKQTTRRGQTAMHLVSTIFVRVGITRIIKKVYSTRELSRTDRRRRTRSLALAAQCRDNAVIVHLAISNESHVYVGRRSTDIHTGSTAHGRCQRRSENTTCARGNLRLKPDSHGHLPKPGPLWRQSLTSSTCGSGVQRSTFNDQTLNDQNLQVTQAIVNCCIVALRLRNQVRTEPVPALTLCVHLLPFCLQGARTCADLRGSASRPESQNNQEKDPARYV
ncbi:hypothetical protein BV25DRAFT_471630 [Artomyces pyxidatus]|uniref:Uncharacterized protein n=1 Tax=Artomyces pyxidatus TaxID=48021 RepID=A0ACB8T403_9AGAM|nr:hypothetical protein BV25DRAFT_471630 [Artomyces pyxidatus]